MLEHANAAAFWMVAAVFVWFFYGPWQNFWTDWYRQEVFAARDHLFDMATHGKVMFSDTDYRAERRSLDSMIRFADQTTWPQICMGVLLLSAFYNFIPGNQNNFQGKSQGKFAMVTRPAQKALLVMVIIRAPLLWPLFAIFSLARFWEIAAKGTQNLTISLMSDKFTQVWTTRYSSISSKLE